MRQRLSIKRVTALPDKYQSYMRSMIDSTAEAQGKDTLIQNGDTIYKWKRDPLIAEAMVDDRVIVPNSSIAVRY